MNTATYVTPSLLAALKRDPRAAVACPHCLAQPLNPCRDRRNYIVPMHKRRAAFLAGTDS